MWYLISFFLLGVLLGVIIIRFTKTSINKGPNSNLIQNIVYFDEKTNKHYKFRPITYVCPPSINVHELEHSDDEDED